MAVTEDIWVVIVGVGLAPGSRWTEARDAAQHLPMHRAAPHRVTPLLRNSRLDGQSSCCQVGPYFT